MLRFNQRVDVKDNGFGNAFGFVRVQLFLEQERLCGESSLDSETMRSLILAEMTIRDPQVMK